MMDKAWNGHPRPVGAWRAIGAAVIALSLLRWPLTAMLVSPAWGPPAGQWYLVAAVQVSAEVMFWTGAWMVGRDQLRAALARVAAAAPLRTILGRQGGRDAGLLG